MNLLLAFVGILSVPCVIYALSRSRLISSRMGDLMVGGLLVVAGIVFLAFGASTFMESGYLLNPAKGGPPTLAPSADWFKKLGAIGLSLISGGGAIWSGIGIIRPKKLPDS